ncbi:uncharacterized protein LOC124162599 isoform X2 [Ischnura elegans]|uniref:uncharacterized protein LOC124162599 isoform X2 n=1 Tax=Ischnura elegans TaxID=197161 RepID=UPI001ED89473|nr:uncharacterized protein LOC124162599 isoform X2 [Ischnura elegans]
MAQYLAPEGCFSHLLALSDEILVMIFSLLHTEDLKSLSKVCQRFDGILMDSKLCKNVIISPKSDVPSLDYIGLYFRKRRTLIRSINISSCYWIPLPKVVLMTNGLTNLVSLNVINISMPMRNLAKILKEAKQLRELSWSWINDPKPVPWSEVPYDSRSGLTGLEKLHVCLPKPWGLAARELYGFCENLTHLTVEVLPSSWRLPMPRTNVGENLSGPTKLKSLIAWRNLRMDNFIYNHDMLDLEIGQMLMHFWVKCGLFNRDWQCLWTNAYDGIPWSNEISPDQEDINFPPLIGIAPKLQTFGLITNRYSEALNLWMNAALGSLEHLVELNLYGMHYCCDHSNVDKLWMALKSLKKLKKLAVAPCVLPRYQKGTNPHFLDGKKFLVSHTEASVVDKKIEDLMRLHSVECLEVGNSASGVHPSFENVGCCRGTWIPYIATLSSWTNLAFLALESIVSLRSLQHFKLVALGCKNLTSLIIRNLGMKGHCGYVKDIAVALPHCKALKHFRLDQPHIQDHIKSLLSSLSHCINLETIVITNHNTGCSHLVKREDLKPMFIQVANACPLLTLIFVPLREVTIPICNKIKNKITLRLSQPRKSPLVMEFCSYHGREGWRADTYHEYFKFPCHYDYWDELNMLSKVALSPPWKHTI